MKMKLIFTVLLFVLMIGSAHTLDELENVAILSKRYGIQPSFAISLIIEGSSNLFKDSNAADFYSKILASGLPLGVLWGDFSSVTRAEANTKEYRRYWLVRYIGYLHHPDMNFTPWERAAAFYDGDGNVLRGQISSTGRAFADRVIHNISLYTSYDEAEEK